MSSTGIEHKPSEPSLTLEEIELDDELEKNELNEFLANDWLECYFSTTPSAADVTKMEMSAFWNLCFQKKNLQEINIFL